MPHPRCRRCLFVLLQTKDKGEPAKSTTEEEFKDNLYHIVHKFEQKTGGDKPVLSFDNNKIQAIADISVLEFDNKDPIHIDVDTQRVHLPTYSPDMDRPIEHMFGFIEGRVRNHLYDDYQKYATPTEFQKLVHHVFTNDLVEGAVERNVDGLPLLWHIISTPLGEEHTDANRDMWPGSGGDYPSAQFR